MKELAFENIQPFEGELPEPIRKHVEKVDEKLLPSLGDFQRTKSELPTYTQEAGVYRPPTETRPPITGESSDWTEKGTWNSKPTAIAEPKTPEKEVSREEIERQRPKTEPKKPRFSGDDQELLDCLMWRVVSLGYVFYVDDTGAVLGKPNGFHETYRWCGDLDENIYHEVARSNGSKRVSDVLPLETVRDLIRRAKMPSVDPTQSEIEKRPAPKLGSNYDERILAEPFPTPYTPRPRPKPAFDPFEEIRKRNGYY